MSVYCEVDIWIFANSLINVGCFNFKLARRKKANFGYFVEILITIQILLHICFANRVGNGPINRAS